MISTYLFEVADQTNRNQDSRQNVWRSKNRIFPRALKGRGLNKQVKVGGTYKSI